MSKKDVWWLKQVEREICDMLEYKACYTWIKDWLGEKEGISILEIEITCKWEMSYDIEW